MPFKHSITRLFDPLLTTKRLVVFDYLGIFETTEGPVASLGQTQKIGLCTFFLFSLGFSQEFLTVELFGPSTRDRKLLILGRFHRFRTVSAKVSTTGKGAAYNEI